MMSRYELRWSIRHPLRWARNFWLHLVLSGLMALLAFAWGDPLFEQVPFYPVWPLMLSWIAGLVIATAIVPFGRWLVAVTGAAMMAAGLLRGLALTEVAISTPDMRALAAALIVKEGLLFCVGAMWPTWTRYCGTLATVEAGVDDRERIGG